MARFPFNQRTHNRAAQAGFTLIELLVVISIIALLIAILLPALSAAQRSAKQLQCMSNVRQLATAGYAFSTDHDGSIQISSSDLMFPTAGQVPSGLRGRVALFPDGGGRIKDWASALVPYLGGSDNVTFEEAKEDVSKVFRGPSDPHEEGHQIFNNIAGGERGTDKPISYAVNADITTFNNPGSGSSGSDWGGGQFIQSQVADMESSETRAPVQGRLDQIKDAASTMMFADGGTRQQSGNNPANNGEILMYTGVPRAWGANEAPGTLRAIFDAAWARVKLPIRDNAPTEDRHNNGINVAFSDGHAAHVKPNDMDSVALSPYISP